MCYSPGPDNWALAVGSHNNMIYILEIDKNYKQYGKTLTGHSSFITSMDWSQDDKWMRSTCGAHELLFWKPALATDKGKRSTGARQPSGASGSTDVVWSDHASKLGWCVEGITPSGCDGTHINAVTLSQD